MMLWLLLATRTICHTWYPILTSPFMKAAFREDSYGATFRSIVASRKAPTEIFRLGFRV